MTFITRAEAQSKVDLHWQSAVDACRAVRAPEPRCNFDRATNYEIEGMLGDVFGDEWCVSEWCPIKGWMISRWQDHCPREQLDEVLAAHRADGYDRVVPMIEEKIVERFGKL